jgi:hypothetical protein
VSATGWSHPIESARRVVGVRTRYQIEPAFVLQPMVVSAECFSATVASGSHRPGDAVIDIAEVGSRIATRHPTGLIPHDDVTS